MSYVRTPEHREKMRQALLGKKHDPESIEKMRQVHRQMWENPEYRAKCSTAHCGPRPDLVRHVVTQETRAKMSLAQQNRRRIPLPPEAREKIRQANLGRKDSQERRNAVRQGVLKAYAQRPEIKDKLRQARLAQRLPREMTSIEVILMNQFKKRRLVFEMHKKAFNRFMPDFTFESVKLFVQADGDYWHGLSAPLNNLRNDKAFNERAEMEGWTVWRFSETKIETEPEACGKAVARFIKAHDNKH